MKDGSFSFNIRTANLKLLSRVSQYMKKDAIKT